MLHLAGAHVSCYIGELSVHMAARIGVTMAGYLCTEPNFITMLQWAIFPLSDWIPYDRRIRRMASFAVAIFSLVS